MKVKPTAEFQSRCHTAVHVLISVSTRDVCMHSHANGSYFLQFCWKFWRQRREGWLKKARRLVIFGSPPVAQDAMHPDAGFVAFVVRRGRKIATARLLVAAPWASLLKPSIKNLRG